MKCGHLQRRPNRPAAPAVSCHAWSGPASRRLPEPSGCSPHIAHAPQDTVVAVRRGGDQLVVCNVDVGKYPEKVFSVDPAQASRGAAGRRQGEETKETLCVWGSDGAASGWLLPRLPSLSALHGSERLTSWAPLLLATLLPWCGACLVQEVDVGKHNWGNYFVAAYKVSRQRLAVTSACLGMASATMP